MLDRARGADLTVMGRTEKNTLPRQCASDANATLLGSMLPRLSASRANRTLVESMFPSLDLSTFQIPVMLFPSQLDNFALTCLSIHHPQMPEAI
jgi:hypothetical protein